MPPGWESALASEDARSLEQALARERAAGGYGDMVPVAAALLRTAAYVDDDRAGTLIRVASAAAPSDPRPHALRLRAALEGRLPFTEGVRAAWEFLATCVRDPWVQASFAMRSVAVACGAAWVVVLTLVVWGLVVHGAALFHDYADCFPWRLRRFTPMAFGALTLAVLGGAGVGPGAVTVLVALLLAPYLARRVRAVLGLALVLACMSPPLLGWATHTARPDGRGAWALYRIWKGDTDPNLDADLTSHFGSRDPRAAYARAALARRRGQPERAAALLLDADARPDLAGRFRLELGNLAYLAGDTGAALEAYRQAATLEPEEPLPWLNQHIAHLARLELGEADTALSRAEGIERAVLQRYKITSADAAGTLVPVSQPLPASWVRSAALAGGGSEPAWLRGLRRGLLVPADALRPVHFAAFCLVLVLLTGRPSSGRRSHACPSCGFLVCPRCSRRVKGALLCPACWSSERDAELDVAEKERQADRVERWQAAVTARRRLGRFLLPGWAEFLSGGRPASAALGVLWAGAAGAALCGVLYPVPLLPWGGSGLPWVSLALLALCYALAARQALGHPLLSRR